MDAQTQRLIEINFPLQVHADEETTQRLVKGEPRIMSALLYQAADDVAVNGVRAVTPLFRGEDLKREAPVRKVRYGWAEAFLMFGAGFVFALCVAAMLP